MTPVLHREDEGTPETRPAVPAGLFTTVAATPGEALTETLALAALVPADAVWARLEDWITHRWGVREVAWVVSGPGAWEPRLRPATITATEVWRDGDWQAVTLEATPLGGLALELDTYRITADVGAATDPPAAVWEAFRRLALFYAQSWDHPGGVTSANDTTAPAALNARALHYSGAADLLRRWRA